MTSYLYIAKIDDLTFFLIYHIYKFAYVLHYNTRDLNRYFSIQILFKIKSVQRVWRVRLTFVSNIVQNRGKHNVAQVDNWSQDRNVAHYLLR